MANQKLLLAIVGLVAVAVALLLARRFGIIGTESFQLAGTCGEGTACFKCSQLTSCSTCLAQEDRLCGWCADAGRCVQKTGLKPALPIEAAGATGAGDYYIPKADGTRDAMCSIKTFVARKEDCADFDCTSVEGCGDCSRIAKCMFCTDTMKCYNKKADGTPDTGTDTTACASAKQVTSGTQCPPPKCETFKTCGSCVSQSGCGFCAATNKCVSLDSFGRGVELDAAGVPKKNDAGEVDVKCQPETMKTSAYQCSGSTAQREAGFGESEGEGLSQEESAALIALQRAERSTGLLPGTGSDSEFMLPNSEGPVSPGKAFTTVTAPGVARPVGSGSMRPTYPAASGLPGKGPFEDYIQSLVRSELSAQGVPVTETFQVQDILQNTGTYMSGVVKSIFKPIVNLRFLDARN